MIDQDKKNGVNKDLEKLWQPSKKPFFANNRRTNTKQNQRKYSK